MARRASAEPGMGGGMIQYIFGAIILLAVLGLVTNVLINALPAGADNLGVMTGISTYGPIVVTMIFVSLILLVVGYMLRYFGIWGG